MQIAQCSGRFSGIKKKEKSIPFFKLGYRPFKNNDEALFWAFLKRLSGAGTRLFAYQ